MKRVFASILVLTLLAGLAGCGSTPAPAAPTAAPPEEGPPPEPTSPPLAEELHVYNWSEYIDPEIYDEFEQEFGVRVIEDTFSSNEDLLAKLQAGATGYDIIVPSDYMVTIMRELELLAELDYENIPNFENIDPKFLDPPYDPGNTYCVPYQWGTSGIGYDSEVFDEAPDSWAYLFDPEMAGPYANKMSMLNDTREAFAAALKYLGYSLNTTEQQELEEAKQLLIEQKEWVSTYDSEGFEDLLAAGETMLAHGWSGDFFAAAEEAEQIWYVIPEEGGVIWTDNLCIPDSAPEKYTAEVFIDYLLRPEVGAKITNYTWYGSPNQASEEYIDAEILEEPAIYPPPEVMEKLEFIRDVGETTAVYERMWTEIKTQ